MPCFVVLRPSNARRGNCYPYTMLSCSQPHTLIMIPILQSPLKIKMYELQLNFTTKYNLCVFIISIIVNLLQVKTIINLVHHWLRIKPTI